MIRRSWGLAGACCLIAGLVPVLEARGTGSHEGGAASLAGAVSGMPEREGRARAILAEHCARCHQSGWPDADSAATLFRNILDLEALARDASLVRPGLPDASRLYTVMLRQAMPPPDKQGNDASEWMGPDEREIEAVRDWIEGLPAPPPGAACARWAATPVGQALAAALAQLEPGRAPATRFIIVRGALESCADPAPPERRGAVERLARHLARGGASPVLEPADPDARLLRVSLDGLGWSAADWETLVAGYPERPREASAELKLAIAVTGTAVPAVRADWLAHFVLRGVPPAAASPPDEDGGIAALAREWARPVGLDAAAGELGMGRDQLEASLSSVPGLGAVPARRLLQGLISRAEFQALRSLLVHGDAPVANIDHTALVAPDGQALELALWSDKPAYARGELLAINAAASGDCHLTLIGIDRAGTAVVLFPNEIEPDNLLPAGRVLKVPAKEAGYQLRLADAGRETIVGVCTTPVRIADGIRPDYTRQRFTFLGDWRRFLARARNEKELVQAEQGTKRVRSRAARRVREPARVGEERPRPEQHARTAISFDVR